MESKMILSDIALIVDCPHSTAPDEGEGYPLIRTPNIGRGRLLLDGVHRVSKEVYDTRNKRIIPQENDILFAREAPAGNAAIISKGQQVCMGQRTVLIRPDIEKVDPHYLVYYLLAPQQQSRLLGYSHGSTVGHVNIPDIKNLKVDLPDINTQRIISKQFMDLDNYIENINQRIKSNEYLIENIYKEWFVRYRFPGHEKVSFRNGVPDCFEYVKFADICTFVRGVSYASDEIEDESFVNLLINLKNINDYGGFRKENYKTFNGRYKKDQTVTKHDLVMAVTEMVQERRIIGYTGLVPSYDGECIISADLIKINSEIDNLFLFSLFTYGGGSRCFSQYGNGTNVIHLKPSSIRNVKLLVPCKNLIKKYVDIVSPMFDEIDNLRLQKENIIKQRDLLFPRVMTGRLQLK